ncbi:hypothetical protein MMC22_003078 [Lobaria immixta]|nr:hypothetical protein [Lobaria immixta]
MLGTVYWKGDVPPKFQLAMNVSTLLGSMIGQVLFGILADIYGRRKMYGLELVVTIFASLGFATASPGVNSSMSMIGWLIFWRIVMGAGIGADYPLSAVITAEFAPTRHRARMVAAVFFFQPLGQLLATLMAFAATEGFRKHILHNNAPDSCSIFATDSDGATCARTVDRVWRLVSGLGTVPAAIAIVSRLTIPESVSLLKMHDTEGKTDPYPQVYWVLDVKNDTNQAMQTRDYWPTASDPDGQDDDSIQLEEVTDHGASTIDEESHVQEGVQPGFLLKAPSQTHDDSMSVNYEDPSPREQSLKDFRNFLFGAEGSWTKGNWTDLFAASLNWMLFDFTYYMLGVNSSRLVPNIFKEQELQNQGPYSKLIKNEWHTLVATSIGAVLGGAIAIKIMSKFSRKKIQMWCFLALATFFVVLGVLYVTLLETSGAAVIVAIYVICQFLFNVGPNTTTFLIPAEAFPTRYRCTCHGISAASGKLGSVLGQVVITKLVDSDSDPKSKRVGYLLIS